MDKFISILVGLVLLLIPIYAWITNFWNLGYAAGIFFKGALVWVVLLIGLVMLLMGLADLRN